MKPFLDKSALLISLIFSPFLMIALFGLLVIERHATSFRNFLSLGGIYLLVQILPPLVYIYFQVKAGHISDIHISKREERIKPLLLSLTATTLLSVVFIIAGAPWQITTMSYTLIANGLVFLLITNFWKISIHLASFFGTVTMAALLIDPRFIFLFIFGPLIAWARFHCHCHNLWQVLLASIISTIVTILTISFIAA